MKPFIPYSLLAAAAACGFAFGQTATTTPVGYITHAINGSGQTLLSPSLIESSVFAGAATVSPSGGAVITFSGGVPTDLGSLYVLELTDGASEGFWSTVVSSTATTITVADAFPAGLPVGVKAAVRKHSTLKSFLGANNPGLADFDGVNANDEVLVLNPLNQSLGSFAWVTAENLGAPEGAWFDLVNSVVANDFVIEPGTAISIKRIASQALSFTSVGEVKTTKTQVDIFTNFNYIGTPLATGGTLNGMNFNTQLVKFDGVSPNFDELQFLRPSQSVDPFAAIDDGAGGATMFDLVNSVDGGAEPFKEGTGVIINRVGSAPTFITLPGTVVAP